MMKHKFLLTPCWPDLDPFNNKARLHWKTFYFLKSKLQFISLSSLIEKLTQLNL